MIKEKNCILKCEYRVRRVGECLLFLNVGRTVGNDVRFSALDSVSIGKKTGGSCEIGKNANFETACRVTKLPEELCSQVLDRQSSDPYRLASSAFSPGNS